MQRIKVGIAGATGDQGRFFIKCLQKNPSEVCVSALCDTKIELLKALAREIDCPVFFTDFTAMLKNADIDLVVIATPDYLHGPMAIAAAIAGKSVICDKPLGLDFQEAKSMYDTVCHAGVGHVINFQYRYHSPAMKELKKMVDTGSLGRVVAFNGRISVPLPNLMPATWRQQKEKSAGGALADCGSHLIDMANWIFASLPEKVIAFTGIVVPQRPFVPGLCLSEAWKWGVEHKSGLPDGIKMVNVETPDYAQLMLEFPGHRLAVIRMEEIEMLARIGPHVTVEVHAEKATCVCETDWSMPGLGLLRIYRPETSVPEEMKFSEINSMDWMVSVMKEAISAIKARAAGKTHPFPSFQDGANVQQIIQAAVKSVAEARWINLIDIK